MGGGTISDSAFANLFSIGTLGVFSAIGGTSTFNLTGAANMAANDPNLTVDLSFFSGTASVDLHSDPSAVMVIAGTGTEALTGNGTNDHLSIGNLGNLNNGTVTLDVSSAHLIAGGVTDTVSAFRYIDGDGGFVSDLVYKAGGTAETIDATQMGTISLDYRNAGVSSIAATYAAGSTDRPTS